MPDIGILRGACAVMNQLRQQTGAQAPDDLVGRDLLDAAERHLRRRLRESLTGSPQPRRALVVLQAEGCISSADEKQLMEDVQRALDETPLEGAKVLVLDSRANLEVHR
jgi:hypothetical protein